MSKNKNYLILLLPIALLVLASLACGTGTSTSHKIIGDSGETRIRIKEADGSDTTSVEINEDWSWTRVNATATLFVETGSCTATITGDEGTAITIRASQDSPAQVTGQLVTDGFGDVSVVTDSQGVTNLDLLIEFSR